MTYLAVPIAAETLDEADRQIGRAVVAGAEMLELRTDYLAELTREAVIGLLAGIRERITPSLPVIVTCRDPREGGAKPYPEAKRLDVLVAAIEAGAEFVDVEYANFRRPEYGEAIRRALAAQPRTRLILSTHNFEREFPDIRRLQRDIRSAQRDAVPKLAYKANHIETCFDALELLREAEGDCLVLCMGEVGTISRVLAKKFGGLVTFASIDEQAATAPGQLTVHTLKDLYRFDSIGPETQLFGVIADPVAHSLSPAIHNACFTEANVDALYLPLLVQGGAQGFDAFLDGVLARPWLGFRGFSITIPHKHSALEYVRRKGGFIDPLTEKIGAANTLLLGGQRQAQPADGLALSAYNTDYTGALDAITTGMDIDREALQEMRVAVVGAGGVSRAIVAGLTDAGARVTIYNRTVERAEALAGEFGADSAGLDALTRPDAELIVNCTSIGMHPHVDASPVPPEAIRSGMTVFDTVYNPAETLLLRQAKAAGATAIDGITMFVNQAAAQFHLFTGQPANTHLMRKVVLDSL